MTEISPASLNKIAWIFIFLKEPAVRLLKLTVRDDSFQYRTNIRIAKSNFNNFFLVKHLREMSYLASFTIQWQKILFKTANMNILTKIIFSQFRKNFDRCSKTETWIRKCKLDFPRKLFFILDCLLKTKARDIKQMLGKWYWASDNKVIFNEQNWWNKTLFTMQISMSNFYNFTHAPKIRLEPNAINLTSLFSFPAVVRDPSLSISSLVSGEVSVSKYLLNEDSSLS